MEGGKYTTWFPDDGKRELRVLLYKLENCGLVKLNREKEKSGLYNYMWSLTNKCKEIVEKDGHLQKLQRGEDILKFFTALMEKVEEKEFFIS